MATEWAPLVLADFGGDRIIRTDKPQTLRCGTLAPDDPGRNCTSGCRTRDHRSYHDCLRAKNPQTYLAAPSRGLDGSAQKRWDAELDRYHEARRQGIQPDGTTMARIVDAERRSDEAGAAYGRDFNKATPFEED